ncbi:MAG: hypothetical protein KAT70_05845 [Thermoplasmata archaeon]|nr:hypothetical protein [Thermoplasmata archaeon]
MGIDAVFDRGFCDERRREEGNEIERMGRGRGEENEIGGNERGRERETG